MFSNSKLKSNIWKFYLISLLQGLVLAYVIAQVFRQSRGITVLQLVALEIIYSATILLLDVPTGALADRWSRKKTLLLSIGFEFLEFFLAIFSHSFLLFAISLICGGIATSLFSGTFNALIYDTLKNTNRKKDYVKFIGRLRFVKYFIHIPIQILGGVVAYYLGMVYNFWFSLIPIFITFLIMLTIKEPKIHTTNKEVSYWKHIKIAGKYVFS
ncbi:MAG: MFS transporter, partial [archaeon]